MPLLTAYQLRVLTKPYWVEDPLAWQDAKTGYGLAFFAKEARPGMFNLAWLMLNQKAPPLNAALYQQCDLQWVIQRSSSVRLYGRTLEYVAAVETLPRFTQLLIRLGSLSAPPSPDSQLTVYDQHHVGILRHLAIQRIATQNS